MATLAKAISKARDADNLNMAISPRASIIGKIASNVSKIITLFKHSVKIFSALYNKPLTMSKYLILR